MADSIPPNDSIDVKTRANLSYMFTIGSIAMLSYILYMWGSKTEILTLIIGLIGGTLLGSVSGVFFGGGTSTKKPENAAPTVSTNADTTNVTVTNPPPTPQP
jgi:hypothetical protein